MSALADAVQVNNYKIDQLSSEVAQKPDDAEVKFITGLAEADRRKVRKAALTTAVVSALVSSAVAFGVADHASSGRCEKNAQNIDTLVSLLESFEEPAFQVTIDSLKKNRNEC